MIGLKNVIRYPLKKSMTPKKIEANIRKERKPYRRGFGVLLSGCLSNPNPVRNASCLSCGSDFEKNTISESLNTFSGFNCALHLMHSIL